MAWNHRKRKVRFARGMWMGRLVLVSVLMVGFALWYVWLRVQRVNMGYQMRAKERHLVEMKKENQVLRMKIAQMKSPKNIEAMIRSNALDLASTKNWQLIVLPKVALASSIKTIAPQTASPALLESLHHAESATRVPMR